MDTTQEYPHNLISGIINEIINLKQKTLEEEESLKETWAAKIKREQAKKESQYER